MKLDPAGFAPPALVNRARGDDSIMEEIEKFLPSTHHLNGGLLIVNKFSGEQRRTADRYMAVLIFLASYWTIPVQYGLVCDHTGTEVDTTPLLLLKKPRWLSEFSSAKMPN